MKYSLIKVQTLTGEFEYSLVEGISRHTPNTLFYDVVDGTDVESFKDFLIECAKSGDVVNIPEIVSIQKDKKTGTNTIL